MEPELERKPTRSPSEDLPPSGSPSLPGTYTGAGLQPADDEGGNQDAQKTAATAPPPPLPPHEGQGAGNQEDGNKGKEGPREITSAGKVADAPAQGGRIPGTAEVGNLHDQVEMVVARVKEAETIISTFDWKIEHTGFKAETRNLLRKDRTKAKKKLQTLKETLQQLREKSAADAAQGAASAGDPHPQPAQNDAAQGGGGVQEKEKEKDGDKQDIGFELVGTQFQRTTTHEANPNTLTVTSLRSIPADQVQTASSVKYFNRIGEVLHTLTSPDAESMKQIFNLQAGIFQDMRDTMYHIGSRQRATH